MKKLLLLIALTSLFTINATAKTVSGQIIFENDTIDVQLRIPKNIFIYPDYAKLQRKVKYINSKGKKKYSDQKMQLNLALC